MCADIVVELRKMQNLRDTVANSWENFEKPKDILIIGDPKLLVQFR